MNGKRFSLQSALVVAVAITLLALLVPAVTAAGPAHDAGPAIGVLVRRAAAWFLVAAIAAPLVETAIVRGVYGDAGAGHSGINLRFGPDADWRVKPLLKSKQHA